MPPAQILGLTLRLVGFRTHFPFRSDPRISPLRSYGRKLYNGRSFPRVDLSGKQDGVFIHLAYRVHFGQRLIAPRTIEATSKRETLRCVPFLLFPASISKT